MGRGHNKDPQMLKMYLQQMVLAQIGGLDHVTIGKLVNLSAGTVGKVLKTLEAKRMRADMMEKRDRDFHDKAMDRIMAVQGDMSEIVINIAHHAENDRVRLSAAIDMLDRGATKVKEEKVTDDSPFIQVNIANIETKHTEGLMPTNLVEGVMPVEAIFQEEVIDSNGKSNRSIEGEHTLNGAEDQQGREDSSSIGGSSEGRAEQDRIAGDQQEVGGEDGETMFNDLISQSPTGYDGGQFPNFIDPEEEG
jgi:hypothetical protein